MRRWYLRIAGFLLASSLAGCGDTGGQPGTGSATGTGADQFKSISNQMQKNMQDKSYTTKASPEAKEGEKTSPPAKTPGEKTKPEEKSKP
jgi:hypothetical protein